VRAGRLMSQIAAELGLPDPLGRELRSHAIAAMRARLVRAPEQAASPMPRATWVFPVPLLLRAAERNSLL
jgi:hypothetical protein